MVGGDGDLRVTGASELATDRPSGAAARLAAFARARRHVSRLPSRIADSIGTRSGRQPLIRSDRGQNRERLIDSLAGRGAFR